MPTSNLTKPVVKGILLRVSFTTTSDGRCDDGKIAIQANHFLFQELRPCEYLVLTPHEHYGDVREMSEDLNDNAVNGSYKVRRCSRDEIAEFERGDGILQQ